MKMTLVTLLGLLALPLAAEELSGTVTEPACALILEQVNPSDLALGVSGCRIDQNAGGVFPFMVKLQRRDPRGGGISPNLRERPSMSVGSRFTSMRHSKAIRPCSKFNICKPSGLCRYHEM
ncbi:hypothetical protein [Aeromonas schubertii]|uniref:Uncharacterized protein n=1 Tax=Aeromonas schubertii TaxID=652 RepID=A0A0S2SLU7_9GAMM|nr:hypothetical protein [Aeromonas schubertii]ALP42717.1 hypothetical protein WL1483_3298 [Aeromonas schubertii]